MVSIIGIYFGFLTPERVGDFIRVFYIKEETKNLGNYVSTVVLDKLIDIFVLLILAIWGGVFLISWVTFDLFLPIFTFFSFFFPVF